jgi:hypothetical protein
MPLEDKEMRLQVTREISKFDINATMLDVKVINQVIYLGGSITRIRAPGMPTDLRKVLEDIREDLQKLKGITDIVMEVKID